VAALDEVERALNQRPNLSAYLVDVRAQRPLSQQIAAQSGVQHESPQLIIFRRGAPIWHASHSDITASEILRHLSTP
jgi:bacillithiol system protein YtxJ